MNKVINKKYLAKGIFSIEIEAPKIAKKALPGQFVIVVVEEDGERVPLTICDVNLDSGTILLVVEAIGHSTKILGSLNEGDFLFGVLGPLGLPSKLICEDIESLRQKRILLVGGGTGSATLIPQGRWLKEHGVAVDALLGFRSKEFIILKDKIEEVVDNLYISTDDGTYGYKGFAVNYLEDLVKKDDIKYDLAIIVGPMIMMKFTALKTKDLGIPSVVSMNPLMVDGTGMCGACRVTVGGETKFACVDGPEFDGHLVDFDEALRRQGQYKSIEIEKNHEVCDLVVGIING